MDKIKPLDDNDVAKFMSAVSEKGTYLAEKYGKNNDCCKFFDKLVDAYKNMCIGLIGYIIVSLDSDENEDYVAEIERIKRIALACPSSELFMRSKDKLWCERERVLQRDADFFLKADFKHLIKKDSKQSMIESIIEVCKEIFPGLKDTEKNKYWTKITNMIHAVALFTAWVETRDDDDVKRYEQLIEFINRAKKQ